MITAYLKATNRCNVGCSHCYLPESVRANGARMTPETLEAAARFLASMQERARHLATFVLWHGGEPLVMPADFYWEAGAVLDRILPGHTETMQTSLIPFRKDFVPLFRERFNGFVGSSVDFSQRRIGGSVEAYHKLWMAKVDLARENGIDIGPGVVPSTADLGNEAAMVAWFVSRGFDHFNIDRYNAYAAHFPDRPSNAQHAVFLIGLLDALLDELERTGTAPAVGAVRAGITGVLYGVGGDRWGGSCQSDFVVVEPDGSLNNCPDKSTLEEPFGKVDAGYQAFSANKFRRRWIRHQNHGHVKDYCLTCENKDFCGSGCPITPNGPEDGEEECSGYKSYLSHVRKLAESPARRDLLAAYAGLVPGGESTSAYDRALAAGDAAQKGACAA